MAQALRKIQLHEDPAELTAPQVRPRPARRQPTIWTPMLMAVLAVGLVVGALVCFISSYARIARYEHKRQLAVQELAQLDRDCIQLELELDRLASQPQLSGAAQAQGLELPGADRIHYLHVTQDLPRSVMAQTAPVAAPSSWTARSKNVMVAAWQRTVQRLSASPGSAAYAQE